MIEQLVDKINAKIKANGKNQITGSVLNEVMLAMVGEISGKTAFGGVITPESISPQTTDSIFFVATEPGVYEHFSDITIGESEYAFILRSGNEWVKCSIHLPQGPQGIQGEQGVQGPQGEHGIQGEPGPANTLSIGTVETLETGEPAEAEITGDAPNQILNLKLPKGSKGNKGDNAVNPFKGWFTIDNIPTTGQEGDYCNVTDTSVTPHTVTIYRWNTAQNAFADTGETPDTATGETFASGETLQEVAIDSSGLVNPVNTANPTQPVLAQAEDVMQLKAKLKGVTASETKVIQQPVTGSYVKGTDGELYESSGTAYLEIALGDTKSVRFLGGWYTSSAYKSGYAFGHYTDPSDPTTWVTDKSSVFDINASVLGTKEYIVKVPEGATHFRTTTGTGSVPTLAQNFYCYLQNGDTVKEYVDNKFVELKDYVDEIVQGEITVKEETITPTQEIIATLGSNEFTSSTYNDSSYRTFKINIERESSLRRILKIVAQEGIAAFYFIAKKEIPLATDVYSILNIAGTELATEYAAECNVPYDSSLYRARVAQDTEVTIELTPDAKWLYVQKNFSYTTPPPTLYTPELIKLTFQIREGGLEGEINDIKEDIEELQEVTDEVSENVDDLMDNVYGVPTEITQEPVMSVRSGSLDPSTFYTQSNTLYEIDLTNVKKVNITAQVSYGFVLFVSKSQLPTEGSVSASIMRSTYMAVCEGFVPESDKYRIFVDQNTSVELTLNDNCKYLYISKYYSQVDRTPYSTTVTKIERIGGIIEDLKKVESSNGEPLKFIIKDGKCFTTPIPLTNGIYFTVKENYRITNAMLINHLTGEIVNDDFATFSSVSAAENLIYCRKSNMNKMPGFDVIYQIEEINGIDINDANNIVEDFALVENVYGKKNPDNIEPSIYRAFREKVQTSIGNVFTPSVEANNKISASHGDKNNKRFRRGVTYLGVNYSGPTQWAKHVGIEVSMRTFKTAVSNPRSVMYTERIGSYDGTQAKSAYGYNHNSYPNESGAFYGCVCTGLTSYLLGLNSVVTSSSYKVVASSWGSIMFNLIMEGTVNNPDVITVGTDEYNYNSKSDCQILANMLQPMDFIWNTGHCAVISDIYVNEYGDVEYIVIAEQTTPTSTSNAYSPYEFFKRYKNIINNNKDWQVIRKKSWSMDDVLFNRTDQDKEYVIMDKTQYNPDNIGEIDPDITTFAGEGAVFVIGDYSDTVNNYKMFLNIHRGGVDGYTHLQIFDESANASVDTPVAEIDITNYVTDTNLGNNGYILPSDQDEDWIIYNLAEYWNTYLPSATGYYKSRVVRKESNVITKTSGYTHYMMMSMSANINNGLNFSIKGAVPIQYRIEREDGIINSVNNMRNLTPSDYVVEGDTCIGTALPLQPNTGYYVRLIANTNYGKASIRLLM